MIHDLDKTLKKLLIERGKLDKNEIEVAFEQPTGEWASRLSRPTINCWCYDLRENVKLRNMDMNVSREQRKGLFERGERSVRMGLPPLRFTLTYLVTAWARRIEDEHQLFWRALGALAQSTSLDPASCEGNLRDQPYEIPITVGQPTEATGSFTDLWSVLDNQMHLGFNFVATLALDPERGFVEPLVLERQIGVGQSENPEEEILSTLDRTLVYRAGQANEKGSNSDQL